MDLISSLLESTRVRITLSVYGPPHVNIFLRKLLLNFELMMPSRFVLDVKMSLVLALGSTSDSFSLCALTLEIRTSLEFTSNFTLLKDSIISKKVSSSRSLSIVLL